MKPSTAPAVSVSSRPHASIFRGFHYPPDVIAFAVRRYLRFKLSHRDVAEILAERGLAISHVTVWRWVQRFTPLFIASTRQHRRQPIDWWHVDETYLKVAGERRYVYRAIDIVGHVIDIYVATRRNAAAAHTFFNKALRVTDGQVEWVTTDGDKALRKVVRGELGDVGHCTQRYANNRIEGDHSHLRARWRPMRGVKTDETAQIVIEGIGFVQNISRGFYTTTDDAAPRLRVKSLFDEILTSA